jgi:hypothetical protein
VHTELVQLSMILNGSGHVFLNLKKKTNKQSPKKWSRYTKINGNFKCNKTIRALHCVQYDVLWSTSYRTQWSAIIVYYYIYNFWSIELVCKLLIRISSYRTANLDIINVLPLVEGVIVDYHTREKISHSGKRISSETKSFSRVWYFFQSVVIYHNTLN